MLDEDGVGRQVAVDDGRRARVKVAAKTRGYRSSYSLAAGKRSLQT